MLPFQNFWNPLCRSCSERGLSHTDYLTMDQRCHLHFSLVRDDLVFWSTVLSSAHF